MAEPDQRGAVDEAPIRQVFYAHPPAPMEIACPKCDWHPTASARWSCTCGHAWNTFDTAGRCPACQHVWRETQCLACTRFSPHADWYRDLPSVDELLEREPTVEGA